MALDISLVLFFQNPKTVTTWVEGDPLLHLHSLSIWAVLPARASLILSCGSSNIGRYIQSPIRKSITNLSFKKKGGGTRRRGDVVVVLLRVLGYRSKRWKSPAIFHLVSLPKHKAELFPSSITCRVLLLCIKVAFITYLVLQSQWDFHVTIAANEVAQLCPKVWPRQLLGLLSVFLPANHHWLTLLSWRGCSWIQKYWREELYGWEEAKNEGEENSLYAGKYNTKGDCGEILLATNFSVHWQPISVVNTSNSFKAWGAC